MTRLKLTRWRTMIVSLLAVILISFASVPRVQAAECHWYDIFTLFYTCYKNNLAEDRAAAISQGVVAVIEPAYNRMVDTLIQKLANNSKDIGSKFGQGFGEGLRKEMERLFDKEIKPMLKDIDRLLKARIDQTDKMLEARIDQTGEMLEARLKEIDALIEARLKQIDALIQSTFEGFQKTAGKTMAQFQDIVDNTFRQMKKLRQDFRNDVEYFFYRTEYIINTVDCKIQGMQEKMRQDMQGVGKDFLEKLSTLEMKATGYFISETLPVEGKVFVEKPKPSPDLVACYDELELKSPPAIDEYAMIYEIDRCKRLKSLMPKTPIKTVLAVYIDLKDRAARMMCLQRGAGHHATLHYTQDWFEFGDKYDFWRVYRTY